MAVAWHGFPRFSATDFNKPDNVVQLEALLRNKEATGRAKDRIDAEELRRSTLRGD